MIREFVKNYPELVRLEEISKKKVFTSFILINDMSKIKIIKSGQLHFCVPRKMYICSHCLLLCGLRPQQ